MPQNMCLWLYCLSTPHKDDLYGFRHITCIMQKPTFHICKNKGKDQLRSNLKADQHLCFCHTDSTIPLLSKPLVISCACTAWFVSDLFGNHIVGFLKMWLILNLLTSIIHFGSSFARKSCNIQSSIFFQPSRSMSPWR